jgi:hypothetical protein
MLPLRRHVNAFLKLAVVVMLSATPLLVDSRGVAATVPERWSHQAGVRNPGLTSGGGLGASSSRPRRGQSPPTPSPPPPPGSETGTACPPPPTDDDVAPPPLGRLGYDDCGGERLVPKNCPEGFRCIDDARIGGCGMACDAPGICVEEVVPCAGKMGRKCPEGLECYDDSRDECHPDDGGWDCGGICLIPLETPLPRDLW